MRKLFFFSVILIIGFNLILVEKNPAQNLSDNQKELLNSVFYKFQENDFTGGAAEIERFLKLNNSEKHYLLYLNLGNAYAFLNNSGKALENYKNGLRLEPDNQDLINNAVKILVSDKRYEEAVFFLKKNIMTGYAGYEFLKTLGDLYAYIKMYEEASEYYERYLKINPGNVEIIEKLSKINYLIGNYEKALNFFNQLYAIKKKDADLIFKLKLLIKLSRHNEAISLAGNIENNFGADAELFFLKGYCFYKSGNYAGALSNFQTSKLFNEFRVDSLKYINEIERREGN